MTQTMEIFKYKGKIEDIKLTCNELDIKDKVREKVEVNKKDIQKRKSNLILQVTRCYLEGLKKLY